MGLTVATASAHAQAPASDEVGVMGWRIVAGPYPNNWAGKIECEANAFNYARVTGRETGCLLDADTNYLWVWAFFR